MSRPLTTPSAHLAAQYDAVGRRIDARRVRQGRLNAREAIARRAIEAAQAEALRVAPFDLAQDGPLELEDLG